MLNYDAFAYSLADLGRKIGVGRTTLYKFIDSGELKTIKMGARTLITREAAIEFLRSREGKGK